MSLTERPLLCIRQFYKKYGEGCPFCTSSEHENPYMEGNRCLECRTVWACKDLNFDLYQGEILGIVGESGSGKSTLVKSLFLNEEPTYGEMYVASYQDGKQNVFHCSNQTKRYLQNHELGMVDQNPYHGLRMDYSSGGNIAEKLIAADYSHVGQMVERAEELLEKVEIPVSRMNEPPRTFSGGMQQRVQISKALANQPPLLLLDEITTGLDLSVQARVLDLIRTIQQALKVSMIVISHDLSVIRMLTDRTLVLNQGRIVEDGLTDQILEDPQHEYTQLLVHSLL
ncbi:ATP-binding cassette domain-containing protein [Salicibibacter kimchii]|uniref:ATP-binding cassette domain-containing protein n=1 Tax=Salicibibacter kimchii TaxID=2099786 RepID=A0A345BY76_9BACI|nr:ATP-binding cassette domain-containing protein [Salicibibacter kimchii]AXF55907.1 ATP-binding cassette domain-containing protein [Salicibibacter kimchii]